MCSPDLSSTFLRCPRVIFSAWLACLSPVAFGVETPAGVAGTLPEDYLPALKPIIQNAVKQSPQMLLQSIYLAQSAANRYAADSVFWPSLTASAGYGLSGGRTTSDPPSSSKSTGANYTI